MTFCCYRRYRLLGADRSCEWLASAIGRARIRWEFDVWAYVFMPEHVHLLVRPRRPGVPIAAIFKAIKQPVGRLAFDYLDAHAQPWLPRLTRTRNGRTERLFWQPGGGFDRDLVEPDHLGSALNYIHENPVRRGLVTKAADWRWSSAGWFAGAPPNDLPIEPLPPEWS